jgi:hypothetical protein
MDPYCLHTGKKILGKTENRKRDNKKGKYKEVERKKER